VDGCRCVPNPEHPRVHLPISFSVADTFCAGVFSLPQSTVWQVSLLVLATATLGNVLLVLSGVYRLSRPERAVLSALVVSTVAAVLGTMAAVELLAAFAIVRPPAGVFFLGLVVLLGVSTDW
jgi:hypothetical protein